MKRITSIFLLSFALLGMACGGPKVIPDKELGQIFHDALLVNAYLDENSTAIDSTNIYEPILADYGYTVEDLQYTINNFSRRKSARLSDVAEYTILMLAREAEEYNLQVTKLDTIENVAQRRATRTLLHMEDVKATTAADSSLLYIKIPISKVGKYQVQATYTLDSLDKATGRRYRIRWLKKDPTKYNHFGSGVISKRRDAKLNESSTINPEDSVIALEIDFNYFPGMFSKKPVTRMEISDLKVIYTPPIEECVQELFNSQSAMRIFSDSLIGSIERSAVGKVEEE